MLTLVESTKRVQWNLPRLVYARDVVQANRRSQLVHEQRALLQLRGEQEAQAHSVWRELLVCKALECERRVARAEFQDGELVLQLLEVCAD